MSYGVTLLGFVKKTLDVIVSEIQDDERDSISSTLNFLATSVFGILNGIVGDKFRELWDVQEAVYRSAYPDSASGEALDQVCSITGVQRLPATKSTVTLDQLFLDNGTTIPVGSKVSVGPTGANFVTTAAVSNATGYPGTFSTTAEAEETGPTNGYAGTIDEIQTPILGWNAKAALTCAVAETYTLNGLTLTIKVDRGSEQTVTFASANPVSAANAASEIQAQVTGLSAVDAGGYVRINSDTDGTGSAVEVTGGTGNTALGFSTTEVKGFNSNDAAAGRNIESDAALRLRREEVLRVGGAGTLEALRAKVLLVDGVTQVYIFENTDLVTDAAGLPGKSFEVVALGGTDQDIADTIWEFKPTGIEPYGSSSAVVTDSQGFTHTMYFSRPTNVPIYFDLSAEVNEDTYPLDGDDQIKQQIVDFGNTLTIGEDVIALQFKGQPLEINGGVTGVEDVPIFKLGTAPSPTGTVNITINAREIATFDTSDVDVATT